MFKLLKLTAQINLNQDQLVDMLQESPSFSIYKDNYFITGIPMDRNTNKYTADAKFKISFKQRIKNEPLFWDSYAFLTYTQKSFWGIYQHSSPFEETNYNPGISFMKPIFKNNQLLAALVYGIEHESNGRDSIYSRSWNNISINYRHFVSRNFNNGIKLWLPFSYRDNKDLMNYIGYGEIYSNWNTANKRLLFSAKLRKSLKWLTKGSAQVEMSWRPSTKKNFYLILQWWEGYNESLIDYNKSVSMIRFGISLKPEMLRMF